MPMSECHCKESIHRNPLFNREPTATARQVTGFRPRRWLWVKPGLGIAVAAGSGLNDRCYAYSLRSSWPKPNDL
jgi:hypothetical protein